MKREPDSPVLFTKNFHDYAAIAIEAHGLQMYGDRPYAYHLAQVENVLAESGFQENHYRAAAWLHDSVEDTDVNEFQLAQLFSLEVARLVWACSGQGRNRKERVDCILSRLQTVPEAAPIKCADRIANLAFAIASKNKPKLEMYLKEWPKFQKSVGPLMTKEMDKRSPILFMDLEDIHQRAEITLTEIIKKEEALAKKGEQDGKPTES